MEAREIRVRLYTYLMEIPYAPTGKPLDFLFQKNNLEIKKIIFIFDNKNKSYVHYNRNIPCSNISIN